jgi:hypothetical protein
MGGCEGCTKGRKDGGGEGEGVHCPPTKRGSILRGVEGYDSEGGSEALRQITP